MTDEEEEVSLTTPKGRKIVGHVDGVIRHFKEMLGEPFCDKEDHRERLLEIKSMGSYGFDLLRKTKEVEKSYQVQIACYLEALGLKECLFLAKCKDTSELFEMVIPASPLLVAETLEKLDVVLDSKAPDEVQRMYGPKGRQAKLDWHCAYCPYWNLCWKDYEPKFELEGLSKRVFLGKPDGPAKA